MEEFSATQQNLGKLAYDSYSQDRGGKEHDGTTIRGQPLVNATLGLILKYQDDVDRLRGGAIDTLLEQMQDAS